jgi:hypothetical protein
MTALAERGSGLPAKSSSISELARDSAMMAVASRLPDAREPKPPSSNMTTATIMATLRRPKVLDMRECYAKGGVLAKTQQCAIGRPRLVIERHVRAG